MDSMGGPPEQFKKSAQKMQVSENGSQLVNNLVKMNKVRKTPTQTLSTLNYQEIQNSSSDDESQSYLSANGSFKGSFMGKANELSLEDLDFPASNNSNYKFHDETRVTTELVNYTDYEDISSNTSQYSGYSQQNQLHNTTINSQYPLAQEESLETNLNSQNNNNQQQPPPDLEGALNSLHQQQAGQKAPPLGHTVYQ